MRDALERGSIVGVIGGQIADDELDAARRCFAARRAEKAAERSDDSFARVACVGRAHDRKDS